MEVKIMPKKEYSIGDRVEHKLFGKGTIVEIESVGDNTNLTIEFSGNIRKKIISKFIKHA